MILFFVLSVDGECTQANFVTVATAAFTPVTAEEAGNFYPIISDWAEPYDEYTIEDSHAFVHACRRKCHTSV